MVWFYCYRRAVEVWIVALVLYAVAVLEVKWTNQFRRSKFIRLCCRCNNFSQIFEKFWTLLLILSCLDLFGFLNSGFFPLLQIWVVWNWIEVNCFHDFQKTAFCLPMLLTAEFKVWFENEVLLIWMISFIAIESLFMLSQSFSSLCRRCFGGEVN